MRALELSEPPSVFFFFSSIGILSEEEEEGADIKMRERCHVTLTHTG